MKYKENELKQGIKIHTINTNKFKTNLLAVFLTTELNRKTVTKNALISMLLRRGSKNMPTQEEISKQMEEMYGASFDCGLDKTGDNQVLKFYIEVINDDFLPQNNDEMLKKAIQKLLEIVFDPYKEGEGFKKEYIEQEKENLKQKIVGKIDNKARYAIDRCIEEMYGEKAFGLYKFGYVEDLNNIDEKELYLYYKNLINSCKIDIFVSGNIKENTDTLIENNENIKKLEGRKVLEDVFNTNLLHTFQKKTFIKIRTVEDAIKTTALKKSSINKTIEYLSYSLIHIINTQHIIF